MMKRTLAIILVSLLLTSASIGTLISIKSVSASHSQPSTTATIFTEDFEGDFPGEYWIVGDWDTTNGADYWDDNGNRPYQGDWSCWCADIGTHNPDVYDNDMDAFMYILQDLSGYSSVTLSYYYWLQSESSWDFLKVMYFSSGSWSYIDAHSGNSGGWQYSSVSIPSTATRVGFFFDSDSSNCNYEGAYVDSVSLDGTAVEYYVTVNTDPPGRTFTSDGTPYSNAVTFIWTAGTTHTIATTSPQVSGTTRYVWSSWSDGGAMSHTVIATGEMTYTAYFGTEYQHTVSTSPSGRSFTIDGSPYSSSQTQWWASGSSHTIGTTSPQTAGTTRYIYSSWSDGGAISHSVSPTSAGDYTATFNTEYQLTVTKNPAQANGDIKLGSTWYNGVSTASAWFSSGASPAIEVTTPDTSGGSRYVFGSWSGDKTGSTNPTTIAMNSAKSVTANYNTQYYLTVSSSYGSPTGEGWYNAGSTASFSVTTPASGGTGTQYPLIAWTGTGTGSYTGTNNPGSATMNGPVTETASWGTQYYLTVNSAHGTPSGEGWQDSGSSVTCSVTPTTVPGGTGTQYVFVQWTGDASGTGSTSNPITMSAPKTATANWIAQYQLTVNSTPISSVNVYADGAVNPSGTTSFQAWFNESTTHTVKTELTVIVGSDTYQFSNWTLPSGTSTDNPVSIMMDSAKSIRANYKLLSNVGWIAGYVYESDGTTPIASANVIIAGGSGSDITDASGYYNISIGPGTYSVTANKTGYDNDTKSVTVITGHTSSQNFILIVLSPPSNEGWLEGYVYKNGTTITIASATITVNGNTTTTTANGHYNISLAADSYIAIASKNGYNSDSKSISITKGQATAQTFYLSEIPPESQGWAIGHVYVSSSTTPVSGATVSITGGSSTITSSGGEYNLTLAFGSYTITASKTGYYSDSKIVTIITGQETITDFHLRLSPSSQTNGTIEGYVYISGTSIPINGATIQVQGGPSATTDATGYYSLSVSPGTYTLTASKSGHASDTKSVTVTVSQVTTRDFYLTPSGPDTDSDGLPDDWEQQYFGNLAQSASGDPDNDGLTNLQEYAMDTEPDNDDTDGDGIIDGDDPNPLVAEADTDENILNNQWLWIILIIVICAIIGAGLYLRKKKQPEKEQETIPPSEREQ